MTSHKLSGFFLLLYREYASRFLSQSKGYYYPTFQKNHNLSTAIFGFSKNGSRI